MRKSAILFFLFWLALGGFLILDLFLGQVRPGTPGSFQLIAPLILMVLIYAWYRADAEEHGWMPFGMLSVWVVFMAGVAIPYYLIRYKGWRRSLLSLGKFLGMFILTMVVTGIVAAIFFPETLLENTETV